MAWRLTVGQVQAPQPVEGDQGGRPVGAAPAEAGRDRDALAEPEAGPGQVPGAPGQLAGRDQDQVGLVGGQAAALDLQAEPLGHDLDLELVPDGDRLEHRDDLVVAAVGPHRPDVQAEVDLGRGPGPQRRRGRVVCWLALLTGHERPSPTSMPGHGSRGRRSVQSGLLTCWARAAKAATLGRSRRARAANAPRPAVRRAGRGRPRPPGPGPRPRPRPGPGRAGRCAGSCAAGRRRRRRPGPARPGPARPPPGAHGGHAEQDRVDARLGHEHAPAHRGQDAGGGLGGQLGAGGAVGGRPGGGGQPLPDLALHHHHLVGDGRGLGQHLEDQGGGDVVGQVGDQPPWPPGRGRPGRPGGRRPPRPGPAGRRRGPRPGPGAGAGRPRRPPPRPRPRAGPGSGCPAPARPPAPSPRARSRRGGPPCGRCWGRPGSAGRGPCWGAGRGRPAARAPAPGSAGPAAAPQPRPSRASPNARAAVAVVAAATCSTGTPWTSATVWAVTATRPGRLGRPR